MKVSQEVLAVISSGIVENNVFIITGGQLERKIYMAVNEVFENIGGKWNRKLKGHVFESDPTDKIEQVIETGETVNEKKIYQFYETPQSLAKVIIDLADIGENDDVLEPSAGHGAILDYIGVCGSLLACEIDPKKCEKLRTKNYTVVQGDFINLSLETFDRIVMNPPFTKQQDIDHVLKAYSLLREGGKLVAIMSPGFTFRMNKKSTEFKSLIDTKGYWEKNEECSFKESGTMVNTVTVVLEK